MALDTVRMRYFRAIAEQGSFTRAAADMRVAQSALSIHMRALEQDLAVKLFTRTSRGVSLTEAGETLLSHVKPIMHAIAQAEQSARDQGVNPTGQVTLGIIYSLVPVLGIPVLAECKRRFPLIRLALAEGDSRSLRAALETQSNDLAITLSNVATPAADALFDESLYVIGPAHHFAAAGATLSLADALSLPLVLPPPEHGVRMTLESAAAAIRRQCETTWQVEGLAATKALVQQGFGFTILARSAAYNDVQAGHLSYARLIDPVIRRGLVLDMVRNRPPTRSMLAVRQIVLETVARLAEQGHWNAPAGEQDPDGKE